MIIYLHVSRTPADTYRYAPRAYGVFFSLLSPQRTTVPVSWNITFWSQDLLITTQVIFHIGDPVFFVFRITVSHHLFVMANPSVAAPTELQTSGGAVAAAVSIKLPPYWPDDPVIWFAQVEAQFSTRGISSEQTMYHYVVSSLQPEYASAVRELLVTPPIINPYQVLKTELMKRTTASEQKRLHQLLTAEELGDRTPTQLLRRMEQLLGGKQLEISAPPCTPPPPPGLQPNFFAAWNNYSAGNNWRSAFSDSYFYSVFHIKFRLSSRQAGTQ